MKTSLTIAGLGLAAMSLTACGGGDGAAKSSAPLTSVTSQASSSPSSSSSSMPASSATSATSSSDSSPSASSSRASAEPAHKTFRAPTPAEVQQMGMDPSMSNDTASRACRSNGSILAANTQTTCGFAEAVEAAWKAKGLPSDGIIYVKSPATGDTYGLSCHTISDSSTCYTSKRGYVHFEG